MNKNKWLGLVVVILILGYFAYTYQIPNMGPGGQKWQTYESEQFDFAINVPESWEGGELEQLPSHESEKMIAFQSTDFMVKDTGREFPPSGMVESGYQLSVWIQQPSNIKNFADLQAFYKLGSDGHIVKTEKVITIDGEQALVHDLGDYESGFLRDLHMVRNGTWFSLSFSAPANDPKAEELFNEIVASFKAE